METCKKISLALASTILFGANVAIAQNGETGITDDRAQDRVEVWATVEQQWDAQEKGGSKWVDDMLAEDFSGWDKTSPAPRGKVSTKLWNRFNEEISDLLLHELYPLSIRVNGDVGIAHYLYTIASKDADGKIETSNGRYTDILLRTDDGWKFIAWHGGDDD